MNELFRQVLIVKYIFKDKNKFKKSHARLLDVFRSFDLVFTISGLFQVLKMYLLSGL